MPIKMYTTSWCPDCYAAKAFLKAKGIAYEEIDIEKVAGAAQIVETVTGGKRSVPTFDINGKFVTTSPFDRRKLEAALDLS
ncbi:MAG: NrdH-redoxin [Candidatus Tectomicrobia bacterium]|nr:NrdH-redoxin [Candidatus Tectomicrobia bacterium]